MGFKEEASVDAGKGNGCWLLILTFFGGGAGVLLSGLVAGKQGADMEPFLKWCIYCEILTAVCGLGWLMAVCIACETKNKSG